MSIKLFVAGAIALAGITVPSAAPAQYYGGSSYGRYDGGNYGYGYGYGYGRNDRRGWREQRRWERRQYRESRRHYYRNRYRYGRPGYGW